MHSLTVVAVTGVEIEAHLAAITATQNALPFLTKRKIHYVGGMTLAEYNRFIVKELGSIIDTEFALLVQADGYAINPQHWSDDFLEWDYVGAPWPFPPFVGNGGFSLRSRLFMDLSAQLPEPEMPEDMWLCSVHREWLELRGVRFAPVDVAQRFSFELPSMDDPERTTADSFGFHGKHLCPAP